MEAVLNADWEKMFGLDTPLIEIFLRGTIMYLGLFALLRFVHRRETAGMGITDLLVIVLLADAAQNAMAGEYVSITDGLLLVATIVGWSFVLDWLAFRFPTFERLIHPPPLPLIKDGRVLYRNLRQEMITEEELRSQLRQQGITDFSQVSRSYMEHDGRVTAIAIDGERNRQPERDAA